MCDLLKRVYMKKKSQSLLEYVLLLSLIALAFVPMYKMFNDAIYLCIKNIGSFWCKK